MPTVTGRPGLAPLGEFATDTEVTNALADYGPIDVSNATGVDPTGTTECASALNTAIAAAVTDGRRAYAAGTFKIASTITIAGNADLSDATFSYTAATGTAVVVGSTVSGTRVNRLRVDLPKVQAAAKTTTGWSQVSGTVGVKLANLYACHVVVPYVKNFETNLLCYGDGTGCVHNTVTIGHLDNGKINHKLDADTDGWCNDNLFLGGTYSQNSNESTASSGGRMIETAVCTSAVNNNVWVKPCVEGDTPQFTLSIGGSHNRVIQARYEATAPTVRWNSDAEYNMVDGGLSANLITESFVAGAAGTNVLVSDRRQYLTYDGGTSGVLVLENNSSSSYPVDVVMPAGAHLAGSSPATAYTVSRGSASTNMKRTGDTYPRIKLDHVTGQVLCGDGTAAPTGGFSGLANGNIVVTSTSLIWGTDGGGSIGTNGNYRPDYVRAKTALSTGSGATGSRPSAAVAGAGGYWFDTTLGKPIFSTGSAWVLADGTSA